MRWKNPFSQKKSKTSATTTTPPPPPLPPHHPLQGPLCPNCNVRPVAFNAAKGQYFAHCSKACARISGVPQVPHRRAGQAGSSGLCEHCKANPKFREGNRVHDYCGRTCARLATAGSPVQINPPTIANPINPTNPADATSPVDLTGREIPPGYPGYQYTMPLNPPNYGIPPTHQMGYPNSASPISPIYSNDGSETDYIIPGTFAGKPPIFGTTRSRLSSRVPQVPTCKTPGCTLPVVMGENGTLSTYCSWVHQKWTERGCISCRAAPMSEKFVMCEPCYDDVLDVAPVIVEVHRDHQSYKSVSTQFKHSWRHKTACPEVRAIYKIVSTETSMDEYQQYLDDVETRGNFAARGRSRGNENRRWHGTRRKCNIGDRGSTKFCTDPACSLCCILQSSFDLKYFKGATGWGRFGSGIYLSSTSSKSNDYSKNVGITSDWKALLLNKVVVGNGKKLTTNDTSLTEPPQGHDSILAEVGGTLNYDELVVYSNNATRPSYLVMYDNPV